MYAIQCKIFYCVLIHHLYFEQEYLFKITDNTGEWLRYRILDQTVIFRGRIEDPIITFLMAVTDITILQSSYIIIIVVIIHLLVNFCIHKHSIIYYLFFCTIKK